MKAARITAAEIARAKDECAKAGVRLVGLEKRPDGTVKFEFGNSEEQDASWFAGSPLWKDVA